MLENEIVKKGKILKLLHYIKDKGLVLEWEALKRIFMYRMYVKGHTMIKIGQKYWITKQAVNEKIYKGIKEVKRLWL